MRKIGTALFVAFILGTGTAQADLDKYYECARQFAGEKRAAELDMLAGVVTFDVFRLFGGGSKKRGVYDKIHQTCSHHLSDADRAYLMEKAMAEINQWRYDRMPK